VRLTPGEHEELVDLAEDHGVDVSEYVRRATRWYHEVFFLAHTLEKELKERALSTFECNLLAMMAPERYLTCLGGAELTKPPHERR
jgi:hypothetical protein